MTFSSHLACIKNKALQLKDQVQLTKLLIIRKDVAALPLNWRLCCSLIFSGCSYNICEIKKLGAPVLPSKKVNFEP